MKRLFLGLFAFVAVVNAWAEDDPIAHLRQKLAEAMPHVQIDDIRTTPIPSVVEIVSGGRILYISADARYIIYDGDMIDIETGDNLTQNRLGEMALALLKKVPEEQTINFEGDDNAASAGRTIWVFTDHTCPYCRKLHEEIPYLQSEGVTVRYLLYPRAGPDTKPYHDLVSVWCAEDRVEAIHTAKTGGTVEPNRCENPIDEHMRLAREVGLRGTPMMIFDNGVKVPGYQSAIQILNGLEG